MAFYLNRDIVVDYDGNSDVIWKDSPRRSTLAKELCSVITGFPTLESPGIEQISDRQSLELFRTIVKISNGRFARGQQL
jgi:hypothetical protein